MKWPSNKESGFSLIELLVAALIFSFLIIGITQLFVMSLNLQQKASAAEKVQENAQFVIESIAREVRYSKIVSISPDGSTLTIDHPVNGTVVYKYFSSDGHIERQAGAGASQSITGADVKFSSFSFISMNEPNGNMERVTMPMTIQTTVGQQTVTVSLQTTVTSRNLSGI